MNTPSHASASDKVSHRTVVRADNLTRVHGHGRAAVRALDGVNVEFYPGEFAAIMGPSGSGKSTLLHCLAGLDRVTDGQVILDGADIAVLNEKERTRLRRTKIGFVFQAFNLVPTFSVIDNIRLPAELSGSNVDEGWIVTLLDPLGIADRAAHLPSELSGGEQQRVAVARALAGRPAAVFADEPTGNLDSARAAELLAFMRRIVDDLGQSIIMVTHDPAAASYADRVLFFADGRVADEIHEPTKEALLVRLGRLGL